MSHFSNSFSSVNVVFIKISTLTEASYQSLVSALSDLALKWPANGYLITIGRDLKL